MDLETLAGRVNQCETLANTANDAANQARGQADTALVIATAVQERVKELTENDVTPPAAAARSFAPGDAVALIDAARANLENNPSFHEIRELKAAIGNVIGALEALLTPAPPAETATE